MKNRRLLIVDDHPIFRKGIASALAETGDYEELAEAGSLSEAKAALDSSAFGLVIVDLGLPDGSGFELVEERARLPESPFFFVLSMNADQASARRALALGASGYSSKNLALPTLVLGLRLIMAGEIYVEGEMLKNILSISVNAAARIEESKSCFEALGKREREALELLLSGCGTKEMAIRLGVSRRTAENYQSAIYAKLGVSSPVALIKLAAEAGLG